jgi:hypothetical protein
MRIIDYTKGPKETIESKEWESGFSIPSQRTDPGTKKRPSVFIESEQPKGKEDTYFGMYRETHTESEDEFEKFKSFLENLEPTGISSFLKKFRSQKEG